MKKYFVIIAAITSIFCSNLLAQKIPVTNKSVNNDTSTFRFAIVSDRTGGMRAGIFIDAIQKLEIMQPEFVLSVGDLIDGYTEDPAVWNSQWDEFDAIVNQLSMPFYYVPGNHDTSNELLTQVWQERHGRDYYHFLYKNVLFIALNTDEIKGGGIGNKQAKYIDTILSQNTDVKWTLLFMHRPLWSYGDRQGYDAIEKSLGKRPYTLFSGHHHNYRYKMHNEMEHFTLATTGGGSWMRNPEVGELDHITWVTMKPTGPTVAHIDVNGIYDKNLVPDADYEDINALRQGSWLSVESRVYPTQQIKELQLTLNLKNPTNRVLTVSGTLNQLPGLQANIAQLNESLAVGQTKTLKLSYIPENGFLDLAAFNNQKHEIRLTAEFDRATENREAIKLDASAILLVDWQHQIKPLVAGQKIAIDGNLTEIVWKKLIPIVVEQPQFIHEDWDWKGKEDGNFSFQITKNNDFLYVAVAFNDQKNLSSPTNLNALQDRFILQFSEHTKADAKEMTQIDIAYSGSVNAPLISATNIESNKIQAALSLEGLTNQLLELAIPLSALNFAVDDGFRFNIGIMDHDRHENTKPSVLWWRPIWGSNLDYAQSGSFIISTK